MSQTSTSNNASGHNFVVYSSSAGSGKTYTLTRFFIKLLLQQDDPKYFRTIVAITFTNKAANEMKERIFSNLVLLAGAFNASDAHLEEEAQKLRQDYSEYLNMSKSDMMAKSKRIVSEILHNYSDLTVQTIDKFTHKIIRPFAKDLDVSPDFNIELGEDDILAKSTELLLQDTGKNELLTKILIDFAEHKLSENKRYQSFESDIAELCQVFYKEDAIQYLESYKTHSLSFFFDKKDELKAKRSSLHKVIVEIGKTALELMQKHGVNSNDFFQSKSGVGVLFSSIAKAEFKLLNSYHIKAIDEDVWYTKTCKNKENIDSIKEQLRHLLVDYQEKIKAYFTLDFLYQRIFPTALLNEIEKIITEVKQRQNILTLSDFNKMISKLINSSHLSVPFLYERIGERYNHYLIDEFQDTSVLQWNNLLPLVDDSLAKGKQNLIVGDGKQAIYRWRNGDVEQFVKLPKLPHKPNENYAFIERNLEREFEHKNLETNYRSYKNVIEFNNLLYESIRKNLSEYHSDIYAEVSQKNNSKIGGHVRVELYPEKEFKDFSLQRTKELVKQAIENGFEQKDIAILSRGKAEISAIAKTLLDEGYSIVSDESLRLMTSKDVQTLVYFLYLLDDKNDNLAALRLTQLLYKNEPSEEMYALLHSKNLLEDVLKRFEFSQDIFQATLYDVLNRAIRQFKINVKSPYLEQFVNYVWSKVKKDGVSLTDFVRHWKDLELNDKIPSLKTTDVSNAIRLMTIHKSKGLQFPVVILPSVNWSLKFKNAIKWVETDVVDGVDKIAAYMKSAGSTNATEYEAIATAEDEEAKLEALNLLYVATTRAVEQLYMLVDVYPKEVKTIGKLIQQAFKHTEWSGKNDISIGDSLRVSKIKTDIEKHSLELSTLPRQTDVELKIAPEFTKVWGESSQEERDYGNFFHHQIQRVKTEKDIGKVFKSMAQELKNDQHVFKDFKKDVEKMMNNEKIRNIFSDKNVIYNEQEIFYRSELLRIDKIAIFPSGNVAILDFKTGDKTTQNAKQIRHYIEALQELNFTNVKGYLYYTKNNELAEV